MFGQLIQELNQSVLNEDIHSLVEKAYKLNSLRIEIVHKLVGHSIPLHSATSLVHPRRETIPDNRP